MNKITYQQAYEAYRKLKNYFYFDNTSLFIRNQIAEFERDFHSSDGDVDVKSVFQQKLEGVLKVLNENDDKQLESYLNRMYFRYYTKSVEKPDEPDDDKFIINRPLNEDVIVNRLNLIVDAPVEIHIICVLWLMVVGVHFRKAINRHNYAYQFMLTDDEDDVRHTGLQLYQPYYIGYQKWRDTALSTALSLLDNKKDATILSLDVKRYFYSVRVNLKDLLEGIKKRHKLDVDLEVGLISRLTDVLQKINRSYTEKIHDYVDSDIDLKGLDNFDKTLLPVGLLSSGFIGNLVLCKFDEKVIEELNPAYYGRYVDDILFVFSDRKISKSNGLKFFLKENFVNRQLLSEKGDDYIITDNDTLFIQRGKVIMEHFYYNESRAAINKFKNNINKQRSEFRFLPDEEEISKDFDNEAFSIQYSESINKLRSIKEYKEDKYGAAKFLAHKIFLACQLNHSGSNKERRDLEKSNQQILTFFKGRNCIEFSSLWEKVATYFIINQDEKLLNKFVSQTLSTIQKVSSEKLTQGQLNRYKTDLRELLILSVANPLALNLDFKVNSLAENDLSCKELAKKLRYSNMFRHNITGIMGINYTESLYKDEINLYQYSAPIGDFDCKYALYLSPRYVHYDEINVLALNRLFSSNTEIGSDTDVEEIISKQTESFYEDVNHKWAGLFENKKNDNRPLYEVRNLEGSDIMKYVKVFEEEEAKTCNKRIGIVNMKVPYDNICDSISNKPVLTAERRNDLFQIINMAIKEKCEILVLPELSVPFQWLETLISQCKRHDIAIITGLEYYHGADNKAYNCVATILPIKTKYYTTAKAFLRVKNHYAPKEKKELVGRRKVVPNVKKYYHLFHWRKSYFSVYNCFELANINDRALFKSKVDFIVATEWNADVNYYSDIAGSWVRDIHCYFIQCNTSGYGDSCIMRPSKTDESRMVTVKGGDNSTVLVENLDIEKLREFQNKEHILQMDDKSFKLTPPDFNTDDVEIRMRNEDFRGEEDGKIDGKISLITV